MKNKRFIPKMEEQKPLGITSDLSGGINLADVPCSIDGSQSPDMLNFFKKDGRLRLRPGLRKLADGGFGPVADIYPRDGSTILLRQVIQNGEILEEKRGIYIVAQKAIFCFDGNTLERIGAAYNYNNGWDIDYGDYDFEKCVLIPQGSTEESTYSGREGNFVARGESVYLYGAGQSLKISPKIITYDYPTGVSNVTYACTAENIVPYVPLLYKDCSADGTGTKVEEHNMLTGKCVQKFTTDATSTVYRLFDQNIDNDVCTAVYYTGQSMFVFDFEPYISRTIQQGVIADLDRKAGTLTFKTALMDAKSAGIPSNLVVTYSKTQDGEIPVTGCSCGTWFEAQTQLSNGCSRLFLSGNEKAPNRIYYSAANDPTYFACDAYIDVGVPADPITAIGIQYDILAVFKERSIYSLSYSDEKGTASFTVKNINASCGCDMPKTLRLLSNVLVWGNSTGGIFGLQSTTIKDERAVKLLSRKINTRLLSVPTEDLKKASAVFDGTDYFLLAGKSAFILDYEAMSLQKNGIARSIDWFVFSFTQSLYTVFRFGPDFAASDESGGIYLFDESAADDCGEFFDAYWYSKDFDFGLPERLKLLFRFSFSIEAEKPVSLALLYRENGKEKRREVTVEGNSSGITAVCEHPAASWSQSAAIGLLRTRGKIAPFSIINYSAFAQSGAEIR